jgi:hypothetical protein
MNYVFNNNDNDDMKEKINLDELYDRKREVEKQKLRIYQRILNRVHTKIKMTARQKHEEQYAFFVVPEFLIGVPKYDVATCISYIIYKLEENGFITKYTHPNLLFISWKHYIPSYKRAQIKKETGINIDGFGNVVEKKNTKNDPLNVQNIIVNANKSQKKNVGITNKKTKSYTDISLYKPSGIYNQDVLNRLKDKIG